MKKKIIALSVAFVLVAVAAIGATLAYFTDTETKTNTFTVGGVDIEIIEQQRTDDGSALEDFVQDKELYPIVGSAQGAKDQWGLPTAKNYMDKIVTIENIKSDAYIRVFYAIPVVLDNVGDASQNILHINDGNKFTADGDYDTTAATQPTNPDYANWTAEKYEGTQTIDGIEYNVYSKIYNKVMSAGDVTESAFIVGMYLDSKVDMDEETDASGNKVYYYTINGQRINFDFSEGVDIPVFAQGVQADGFDSAEAAFEAAGLPTLPFNA